MEIRIFFLKKIILKNCFKNNSKLKKQFFGKNTNITSLLKVQAQKIWLFATVNLVLTTGEQLQRVYGMCRSSLSHYRRTPGVCAVLIHLRYKVASSLGMENVRRTSLSLKHRDINSWGRLVSFFSCKVKLCEFEKVAIV